MPYQDPDKRREYNKEYRLKNKERIRQRNYYEKKCSEEKKAYANEYARRLTSRFRSARHAADKRLIPFMLSFDEYKSIVDGYDCHYCGNGLPTTGGGLDRMDSNTGYTCPNCVPCCGRCNSTFMHLYSYEEKLILAETLRGIDNARKLAGK